MNRRKRDSRFHLLAIMFCMLCALSLVPLASVTGNVYYDEIIASDEAQHTLRLKQSRERAREQAHNMNRTESVEWLRAIFTRELFSSPMLRKSAFPLATALSSTQDKEKPAGVSMTFTVVVTTDNGDNTNPLPGSLRKAIIDANNNPGLDNIIFNIPGTGVQTITPLSALPLIVSPMIIDGTTQPGYSGSPLIELNGSNAGIANAIELYTGSSGSSIKGLTINRFNGSAVMVLSNNNIIQGNYIGTNAAGTVALGNSFNGIGLFIGVTNNLIGGTTANSRNLISGNSGIGIVFVGAVGNQVQGNYIGTTINGDAALGNGNSGIIISAGASNNAIGGTASESRNLISGNSASGILLQDSDTNNNIIQGNYIGTNAAGDAALGNTAEGIIILPGANNNQIGGTTATSRNIISGNQSYGIRLDSNGNMVRGNYIGTDPSGTSAISNLRSGMVITGGASNNQIGGLTTTERNLISGNRDYGLEVSSSGTTNNIVQGNYIGTSANASIALGNRFGGVVIFAGAGSNVIGGVVAEARNIISGNFGPGIFLFSSASNTIQGNYIGTDASGNARLGNTSEGINLASASTNNFIGGTTSGARNIISGNSGSGIQIRDAGTSGNQIFNNYIGTNAAGNASVFNDGFAGIYILNGASNNIIGSASTGARNLISGNRNYGIRIQSSNSNTIQNNYIGTTADGNAALTNSIGIIIHDGASNNLIGGTASQTGNLISGNISTGLIIQDLGTSQNLVQGNFIGTNASGSTSLGNGSIGLLFTFGATDNTVGGSTTGAGNVIAFNVTQGISFEASSSAGNSIRGNSIFSNGQLGIDLNDDGVTANDAGDGDIGPNNLQNYPVITSANTTGSSITIQGSLNSTSQTGFNIDFYSSPAEDPTHFGEGKTYLGSTAVTTDGAGNANFSTTFNVAVPAGQFVTATATRNAAPLDTSEFSHTVIVSAANPCDSLMLKPTGESFSSSGGPGSFKTIQSTGCNWTAASNDAWITNINPPSGNGDMDISYAVASNPSSNPRTGTINVNGQVFTIQQAGNPTITDIPVVNISAYDNGTLIEWQTGMELNNLGFHLYRQDKSSRTLLTPQLLAGSALIAGQGVTLTSGHSYAWWDAAKDEGAQYWIEDLDLNGASTWHGPFFAQNVGGAPPAFMRAALLSQLANQQAPTSHPVEIVAPLPQSEIAGSAQAVLAARRALKIAITQAGWYRLPSQQLFAAGLDTDVDPRLLQLFVDGAEIPIVVTGADDGKFAYHGAVEFFGVGLDTPSTNSRTYWLTWGKQPGLRMQQVKAEGALSRQQNFPATVESRDRTIYFAALKNGERENFFGAVITTQPIEKSLLVPHLDQSATNCSLEIAVQGVTAGAHRISVAINGEATGLLPFTGISQATATFSLSSLSLREGANQVRLIAEGGSTDVNLLDTIRLTYPHAFTADDDSLWCSTSSYEQLFLDGFSNENIRVFDISNRDAVKELAGKVTKGKQGFGISVTPPNPQGSRLFAVAANRVKTVEKIFLNRESNWRDPNHAADLLLLTHKDFAPSAVRLKEAREKQGLSVALIDIEDLYDEFSFGHKSVAALSEFIRYTQESWRKKPRYLLLFGDASYDPRNYFGLGDFDFVPTKLIDTEYLETASDEALADFNNDGIGELAIGRLPVRTISEADRIVQKLLAYESARPSNEALLVADQNDDFDFERASASLQLLLPSSLQIQQLNRGRVDFNTARRELLEALNRGQKLVNYSGHGNLRLWRGNLLTASDAATLSNSERLSVVILMTCLNGYFQDVLDNSLAESLLQANNGAVVVWASSGLTPPAEQAKINQNLYKLLFAQEQSMPIGEAIRQAKFSTEDKDMRRIWILLGDPTLKIR